MLSQLTLPGFGLSANAKGRFLTRQITLQVIAAVSRQYIHTKKLSLLVIPWAELLLYVTPHLYPEACANSLFLVDAAGLLEKSAFVKHIAYF